MRKKKQKNTEKWQLVLKTGAEPKKLQHRDEKKSDRENKWQLEKRS